MTSGEQQNSGRRLILGMDEAGYGPNLGPLLICLTAWEVPEQWNGTEFWEHLEHVVTDAPKRNDSRLHVADSKKVHSSQSGIGSLERPVLAFLSARNDVGHPLPSNAQEIAESLLLDPAPSQAVDRPWEQLLELTVPRAIDSTMLARDWLQLRSAIEQSPIRFAVARFLSLQPERFNQLLEEYGNKSEVLTRESLRLLGSLVNGTSLPVSVYCDKHGGRNRYLPYLMQQFPGRFFQTMTESQSLSHYRDSQLSLQFSTNSERFFPVAVASMIAKYFRELWMEQFNQYWQSQQPDLKPTKGYPVDAARFRAQIQNLWQERDLSERILWRNR